MTPEKIVQNAIMLYLKKLESNGERIFIQRRQAGGFNYRMGLPDIYVVYEGIHIEIEVKSKTGHQSEMQKKWEKKFKELNIPYLLCNSVDDVKRFINKLKEEIKNE